MFRTNDSFTIKHIQTKKICKKVHLEFTTKNGKRYLLSQSACSKGYYAMKLTFPNIVLNCNLIFTRCSVDREASMSISVCSSVPKCISEKKVVLSFPHLKNLQHQSRGGCLHCPLLMGESREALCPLLPYSNIIRPPFGPNF